MAIPVDSHSVPARSEPATGGIPSAGPDPVSRLWRRRFGHGLLIALGWLLFAWSWHRVTADRPEVGELRVLMVAAVIVVPLLTLSWVAHNVGIYRRKGPRKAGRAVPLHYDQDFNGRTIDADFARLACARRIDVLIVGGVKRFVEVGAVEATSSAPARVVELV